MRYTSLLEPMSYQPISWRFIAVILVLFLCTRFALSQTEPENPWTRPAHDLVREVLEQAGSPPSVAFEVENRSGIAPADLQSIRRALDNEFRAAKVTVVRTDSAVAEVRFILSRNARGPLWIAKVKQGPTPLVSMLEFPEPAPPVSLLGPTLFRLQRNLLFMQASPILDVAIGSDYLLVLGSEQISLHPRGSAGPAAATSTIAHGNPWPRDLRGRIFTNGDAFTAFLPGVRCPGAVRPALSVQCVESDDPWLLLNPSGQGPAAFFSAAQNHFSGVLGGALAGNSVPPFFSAARLGDADGSLWAFSGTDGSTRFYVRLDQPLRTVTSLGSDLAAVHSPCGSGWQLLVSGDGDETAPDSLQAFEIKNRDATAVSEKLSFDGPVTALWTSPDPAQAVAIVRSLGKETYEAYSITVACSR